ncbi:immunity 49 family protein [Streptomyces sp. NPDC029704]|uniref:immunity 49 family protein n=1 Tax=Streptomyces sp. NPDC029704 TaxID=3156920 RepID=UPI0034002D60
MHEVARHEVDAQRIALALENVAGRAWRRWHRLAYADGPSPEPLMELCHELLDHVAARSLQEPVLGETASLALRTAAECSLGALDTGCFPDGDQEVFLPLIGEKLSSEQVAFGAGEQAPTAATWLDTFAICLVSGLMWERQRVIGLLLREDFAPAIRGGVPYSRLTSASAPADLAAMDALCGYLTPASGHDRPAVPLCKPDTGERAEAARRLDAAGPLTADQRLLRVLLDDDPRTFEEALRARLIEHRDRQGVDAAPRTLLPLGPLALAALAVQAHGWTLTVQSSYLPHDLLRAPEDMH